MKSHSRSRSERGADVDVKAKMFRGFADPSRLAILEFLRLGPQCVHTIAVSTGLSQPNTSAHLACLEDCGLVHKERQGKFIFYRLAHKESIALLKQAEAILGKVGDHIFECTRYGRKNGRRR